MRDHMERLVMLPFSFGCVSESSIAVGKNSQTKKHRVLEENLPQTRRKEVKESSSRGRMRSVRALLALPKSGMQRLIRGFKSFSELFVYKEEVEEEEEIERDMEIGFPTDVKHVTHIGWDGSTTVNPINGWENLKAPEIMSFPSISLKQFELAMAAQTAQAAPAPMGVSSTKIT